MTARKIPLERLPHWPRLLSRAQAAAYCGIGESFFDARVPVAPLSIGDRRLWDRVALDRWIDALADASLPSSIWLERLDAHSREARPCRPRSERQDLLLPSTGSARIFSRVGRW